MFKLLCSVFLFCISISTWAVNYDFSAGFGSQYGGLGTQISINHDKSKYFLALGYPGVSIGVKTQFSDSAYHSWGLNAGKMYGILRSDTDFAAITYNYHFNGFNNTGWEVGTGVAYYKQDEYTPLFAQEPKKERSGASIIINFGYTF